jgi:SsrA-binding protein
MRSITKNKQALFDYEILDRYECGIVLSGMETKACKMMRTNIHDAIITIRNGSLIISNMEIPLYERASPHLYHHYDPRGNRTLLARKPELSKILSATLKTGNRIIPLELRESKRGWIKLTIAIAKLKKKVDKKNLLKEKAQIRDMDRQIKDAMKSY